MKEFWNRDGICIVIGEAQLNGRPWDAREDADIELMRQQLGWPGEIRRTVQVHGTRILHRGDSGDGDGFLIGPGEAALVRHADCFPVTVIDIRRRAAAVLHCGWRGAAAHLARQGVRELRADGSRTEDLRGFIGPGIGAADFEVGPEVLEQFPTCCHDHTSGGAPSIDLAAFLRQELEAEGVLSEYIYCDSRSTFGDIQLHSYRRAGAHAGRMATFCLIAPIGGI